MIRRGRVAFWCGIVVMAALFTAAGWTGRRSCETEPATAPPVTAPPATAITATEPQVPTLAPLRRTTARPVEITANGPVVLVTVEAQASPDKSSTP